MKIYIVQPAYPKKEADKKSVIDFFTQSLDSIPDDADLILLPEFANIPGAANYEDMIADYNLNTDILVSKVISTAKRTNSLVAVNTAYKTDTGFRNSTLLYDSSGTLVYRYDKQHLTYAEKEIFKLDYSYRYRKDIPCFIDINGLRLAFMTCYDTYFLEYIEYIRSKKPDMILICSYQRSEEQDILLSQARIISSRCNSYVLRASYSMGDTTKGGHSLVCDCDGTILVDMEQLIGVLRAEIEIPKKAMKPNGHGQPLILADEFITQGRTPQSYLSAGSFISQNDNEKPYPRICAHRGFSALCPENTALSLSGAVAFGADEVEFDLWPTKDHIMIAVHDPAFPENRSKKVWDYTYEEVMELDASLGMSPMLKGMKYDTFEDILKKFNHQTIMNIHIKTKFTDNKGADIVFPYDKNDFAGIVDLIEKYDCADYVYIAGDEAVMETAVKVAPYLKRCCLEGQMDYTLVDKAIKYRCEKLQFFKPYFNDEMIKKAKQNNIRCNIFWSDDPKEASEFLDRGIDTILTNNLYLVQKSLKA
ncbi:MAG: glycerophosphodiester phosphodiesterase family protein [Clostridia bacterium]|jgi:glycerophosphoryl diester phosphodiesterase/predicted amidohydrolase|nr:hypothetical protein [Clostridia bacterium]HPB16345.1 glycerophosphodiester phosphodiesterase family protein [Clostridia bacterium]HQM95805.1 glycerophosphodiester phosphodiesterase family protein [Clostridia bacterium]HQO68848.1 glycerophosphodiester phosphodiesterase family protein [Clostridia bacterium]